MALYEQVLAIAQEYLGDKAEEFLERQCKYHVGVELHDLRPDHLDSLGWWCYMSGSLMLDRPSANTFREQVEGLKEKTKV